LLAWFQLANRDRQLNGFADVFAPDATLDAVSCCDRVREHVELFAPHEDVRPLVATGDARGGVLVFEACGPVTLLWHRVAWAFTARDDRITGVVATSSPGLPTPEDGARSTARP